jgi:hypothetical protein
MIGLMNAEISKAVLFETLTTEASPSGAGSYAQSRTHENQKFDAIIADASGVCAAKRRDLFRSVVELNALDLAALFGVPPDDLMANLPWCSRRIEREVTPKERAEVRAIYLKNGLTQSKAQIRDENAYDVPTGPEDELKGEPQQVPQGGSLVAPTDAGAPPKPEADAEKFTRDANGLEHGDHDGRFQPKGGGGSASISDGSENDEKGGGGGGGGGGGPRSEPATTGNPSAQKTKSDEQLPGSKIQKALGMPKGGGQSPSVARATDEQAKNLTAEDVQKIADSGNVTKADVERLYTKYQWAIEQATRRDNILLEPRHRLLKKVLELWPKDK